MADIEPTDSQQGFATPLSSYPVAYEDQLLMQSNANILTLDDSRDPGPELPDSALGGQDDFDPDRDSDDSGNSTDDEDVQLSPGGILDEETIARGLSNLGRSADGTQQVYLHLTIPGLGLQDVSILNEYIHLQKLEIPYNDITDLSPLGQMPHLLILDASHNKISKLLDFSPPRNLKEVDLSFNCITEMADLSAHHYLRKLCLDNNQISEMRGLSHCKRLSHLSLAHNKVNKIQDLDNLPIKHLNLRSNEIKKIENLETLKYLLYINLSGNQIRSLKGLERHDLLEDIEMEANEIIDINEIQYVRQLPMLRQFDLRRNPIQELPNYRLSILYQLQRLTELDRHKVEPEEKVAAKNLFHPPAEVVAARDHIMHTVFSFLQSTRIYDSTLPSIETPYPMLVLVGPKGSGRRDLGLKLVDEFPDYFGYGVSHTTRRMRHDEEDGKDYHFVSIDQFESEIKHGKFIQTYLHQGEYYGLTMEAIESVAREGLACVVHMELEGVLTLKNTYLEPRYVLVLPLKREVHERRMRDMELFTENQIEATLARTQVYIDYNQEHPGFFDMVIPSDDISEAYKKLRRLVMDYLGINVPTPTESEYQDQDTSSVTGTKLTDTGMGARTWSRPSIPDSTSQLQASTGGGVGSKAHTPVGRGVVEAASLSRRKSAAKEAVAGLKPSIYDEILKYTPTTAPAMETNGLGEGNEVTGQRSRSAPGKAFTPDDPNNMDQLPPSSPDSSHQTSRTSTSLSNISSAQNEAFEETESQDGSGQNQPPIELPSESMDPMELMSPDRATKSGSGFVFAPPPGGSGGSRPHSAGSMELGSYDVNSLPAVNNSGRPGSHKHRVLPPIGGSPTPQTNTLPEY
ncbi:leucine-rich repeat and guanylate kinase domain-containing protein [Lingula anatina]|uniref:Leucine-rich repeat and guanylate kinase domain-containing protein n=1 Tax=Lingula anatina TaxID=7574 RepID=A0A1S3JTI2_LINAN|nr:leucine-rich repeat and guanylate kinase domain-containing protein [Lingula anatina]|eukprot:XP_013413675.1 leucine-rich repeat and guanylate kinase domain-containing protein [Lingula anatina]